MTNDSVDVDRKLIEKAVTALIKHHNVKASNDLLGNVVPLQVQFGLEVAPQHKTMKPSKLTIPHSVHNYSKDAEVCLIVKDDAKPSVQQIVRDQNITEIKKVLTLGSLRDKHAEYQQRRDLLHRYSFFLADDRILPNLTKALGRDFFKAKKQPVPVRLSQTQSLGMQILKALSATYMTLPLGTCVMVKAGSTDMAVSELVDNILSIVEQGVPKIPRKKANIKSISVKLPDSMALPFYNRTPEQLDELAALAGLKPAYPEPPSVQESSNKRKKSDLKSPLLKALKKQKTKDSVSEKTSSKEQVKKTKKQKTKDSASEKIDSKKPLKTKKSIEENGENKTETRKTLENAAKLQKKSEKTRAEEPTTTANDKMGKKKRERSMSVDKTSEATKKIEPTKETPKKDTSFIAARKYSGTKEGYVFKMGDNGLGYYVDVKPVVNKQLLQAIARMPMSFRDSKKKKNKRRS